MRSVFANVWCSIGETWLAFHEAAFVEVRGLGTEDGQSQQGREGGRCYLGREIGKSFEIPSSDKSAPAAKAARAT